MKQKLYSRDSYALTKHKLKQFKIRYISLLAVLTSMCLYAQAQASASGVAAPADLGSEGITLLQVGDTIPEYLWHLPLPHWNGQNVNATIRLSDFQDRNLILLDFWASYCITCLNGFPLLDSLQRGYSNELKVFLINSEPVRDTPGRILSMFTRRFDRAPKLPIVFPDTIIYRFFDLPAIPRYVWIDRDRVVRAITGKAGVTATAVQTFIHNQKL